MAPTRRVLIRTFRTIKDLDDVAVIAAVVLERDSAGKVQVKEHAVGS